MVRGMRGVLGRRWILVAAAIASLTAVPATAIAQPTAAMSRDDAMERSLRIELNRIRAAYGRRAIAPSPRLARAAVAHAVSMGRRGYFSHNSANGASFDRRIARFYPSAVARRLALGENLLFVPTDEPYDARAAVRDWMASPTHRRNILRRGWSTVGVAAVTVRNAPGVFGGEDVLLLVTDFAG